MTVKADFYQIVLRFPRLFPDPDVFEDSIHLANRYLIANGLTKEKSDLICQATEDIHPIDDRGKPSSTSGTAKFLFEGRNILAEYMSNANVPIDYADFGTGLTKDDHSRLWTRGKMGQLRSGLRDFKHQAYSLNIPDISELYQILKERANPNTLSTVELESVPSQLFRPALSHIETRLRTAAKADGLEVEVYAAKALSTSEKAALERRLTRQSGQATIFVILSKKAVAKTLSASG